MSGLYFTRQDEWVRFSNHRAFVGLTGRGIDGDVVYIELPEIGQRVSKNEPCAKVESTKTVVDVHSPATGEVTGINDTVYDDPDVVVKFPLKTWLFYVEFEGEEDTEELLEESEYNKTD